VAAAPRAALGWRILDTIVDLATALAFLVMTGALALQVIFRYFLNRPIVWVEDFSILFFAWFVWLGGAAGMLEQKQIRVDVVDLYAPRAVRRVLEPLLTVLSIAFLVLVVVYGVKVTAYQRTAEYDVLPFSRAILYAVAPVIGSVMILNLMRALARQLRLGPGRVAGEER
jgi:TRAP-type C4-dicarboxylate transport system permease small subunit